MAPSRDSGTKMRNLLFGVILGLLAVVHSTPVNTVTQNPSEAEDDFFREAMTDGFLVEHSLPTLLTTESLPKKQTDDASSVSSTTQIPQSGVTTSPVANETQTEESSIPDGSGDEGFHIGVQHYTTTTQSVTHIQSTTSAFLPRDTDSDSPTTQIPQSGFTSSLAVNEGSGDSIMSIGSTTQSVSHGQSSTATLFETDEGSSSGSSTTEIPRFDFTSSYMLNEASTLLPTSIHSFNSDSFDGSGDTAMTTTPTSTQKDAKHGPIPDPNVGRLIVNDETTSEPRKAEPGTPGWIIIVGFIVGVAALVMLCVAIATRDKWNGPSQASQVETNTNSTNEQRALEMETFLHKDTPRENGKASDYTVIPLDELSENYSSH